LLAKNDDKDGEIVKLKKNQI